MLQIYYTHIIFVLRVDNRYSMSDNAINWKSNWQKSISCWLLLDLSTIIGN